MSEQSGLIEEQAGSIDEKADPIENGEPIDWGRRRHYGEFYGLAPYPERGLPRLVVYGNCLAEALRVCLDSHSHAPDLDTVRLPPVHELAEDELPQVKRLLAGTQMLVAQPVREGYRDLPLGTDEVRRLLPEGAQVVLFPSVRDNSAHPFQVLVHGPGIVDPPRVPYQDLRLIAEVAGLSGGPKDLSTAERVAAYRQIAEESVRSMTERGEQQGTITVHDVIADHPGQFWVLNHPHNEVVTTLATRVRQHLGLDDEVVDPGRVLLGSVRAPVDAEVVHLLGLDREPVDHWLIEGEEVSADEVADGHREFYAEHPEVIEQALESHAERLSLLGWRR